MDKSVAKTAREKAQQALEDIRQPLNRAKRLSVGGFALFMVGIAGSEFTSGHALVDGLAVAAGGGITYAAAGVGIDLSARSASLQAELAANPE